MTPANAALATARQLRDAGHDRLCELELRRIGELAKRLEPADYYQTREEVVDIMQSLRRSDR